LSIETRPALAVKAYLDTSVFGGVFDVEFARATNVFFERIAAGRFVPVVSAIVADEIMDAPPRVRHVFEKVRRLAVVAPVGSAAIALRAAYLDAGIVPPHWAPDALHVAIATTTGCAIIVSWNFKHIVNFRRIPLYNAVNQTHGFGQIGIFTPLEVIEDEDETL
jgi:hypothetical protein